MSDINDSEYKMIAYSVRRACTDTGHDGDQHMLLDSKRTGVKGYAKDLDLGDKAGPSAENREGHQLGDDLKKEERKINISRETTVSGAEMR
jgi:hypothetical protein